MEEVAGASTGTYLHLRKQKSWFTVVGLTGDSGPHSEDDIVRRITKPVA